jgi:hypothetical protein
MAGILHFEGIFFDNPLINYPSRLIHVPVTYPKHIAKNYSKHVPFA